MATTITTHCKMGIVDASGNVNVLYPQTTGSDVSITPTSVVTATTVQGLVNNLKASAFISNFTGINDNSTTSTTATYSASKIAALNSDCKNFTTQQINGLSLPVDITPFIVFRGGASGTVHGFRTYNSIYISFDINLLNDDTSRPDTPVLFLSIPTTYAPGDTVYFTAMRGVSNKIGQLCRGYLSTNCDMYVLYPSGAMGAIRSSIMFYHEHAI